MRWQCRPDDRERAAPLATALAAADPPPSRTISIVIPLVLLLVGLGLLGSAGLVLRSLGPRLRVGRLLATTPRVTVGEALALAANGARRYVRVDGRIDSENEFEDPDHRPLVLRRTRIQARDGSGWRTVEENREQVAFEVREGLDGIDIDAAALDAGLVVVARESVGVAGDLGERISGIAPEVPVRVLIEQVSSVEHATVLGVPVRGGNGHATMLTAGLGRPLVLTTLEEQEAMRVLAEGRSAVPRAAAGLIGLGLLLTVVGLLWLLVDAIL
jgi:hypothetical protein